MESNLINPTYELTKQILFVLEHGNPYCASLREFRQDTNVLGVVDVLELDYKIAGLCQCPVYEINGSEPITISVQNGVLPQVYVRDNFPIVPHLTLNRDGKQRSICYTDLPYTEIKHRLNGRFIVECINEWFVKTARNELHRADQPLEPFFWGTNDVIVLNPKYGCGKFIKLTTQKCEDSTTLTQVAEKGIVSESQWYAVIKICLLPNHDNIIHYPPTTLFELIANFDANRLVTQLYNELAEIIAVRHDQKEFCRVCGSSISTMLSFPCIIMLSIPQQREVTGKVECHNILAFTTEKSFGEILRDFGIEREKKKGRKTNKLINTGKNNGGVNIKIRQLSLQWANIASFARMYNDIDKNYQHLHNVLIGAGALGSQLFGNCIRAGFGKWTIIDDDVIFPHNLARHILSLDSIGQSKATALENYGKSILEDAEISSIVADVFDSQSNTIDNALHTADVIVDVSTSIAAERMLALDVKSEARRISLFLNPCGTHLVMLCEDIERNVTLDLLEIQLYSILSGKKEYAEYFKLPATVAYATSCRDITSRISQDNISLCAAIASKELKWIKATTSASITIWAINDDGICAERYEGELWHSVSCGDWRVTTRKTLLQLLQIKRTERQPNETGGVLIGQYDFSRKIIYIADMIFSPDDSIEAPNSYIRGCDNLPDQIQQIALRTYNNYSYIGEWHSHLGSCTAMSSADEVLLNTIAEVNEVECLLGCMIICGANDNFSVYIRENGLTYTSTFK